MSSENGKSNIIEPAALWQALQDVDDGQDPADVYQRVMNESVDPMEAIGDAYWDAIEQDHQHEPCRDKYLNGGHCYGNECVHTGGVILTLSCPCECHEWERGE